MARPQSVLGEGVSGIGRDHAIDGLPRGYVWDLVDWIPNRKGAKLEGRGAWSYLTTTALPGNIWGGKHAAFSAGPKLIVCSGTNAYDHPLTPGAATLIAGIGLTGQQNGVLLRNRVYFASASGAVVPTYLSWSGSAWSVAGIHASAPKAKVIEVYKDRLIGGGDPAQPTRVRFSPLETDGGPLAAWDALSYVDTSRDVRCLAPMTGQVLVFHSKSIEKIRGSIPPGTNLDTDMYLDLFSDQMGCEDPGSVCQWQENVIFANARGVHLTDGATIRSLTDQGSVGDFWQFIYSRKRSGTQVVAGVFLDFLLVSVLTDYTPPGTSIDAPFTFICDLNDRTWFRFSNFYPTCYIESESGGEEVWAGLDADHKLVKISPTFYGNQNIPEGGGPPPVLLNSVDGNAQPVLPFIDLGWKRLGPEGVKRLRHVYISHQTYNEGATLADVFQVDYQTDIGTELLFPSMSTAGMIPTSARYARHRLNVGKRGYGIRFIVKQISPTVISRLYDIGVGEWAQDRGKL